MPNATLNVVPTEPADQPSVGDTLTPVAASDGLGLSAATGGPAGPAVVKVDTDDAATRDAFTGVALVRATTFHT